MSFILKDQVPTRHIEVGGGNWVDVKTRLTVADRDAINAAMVKFDDEAIFGAALKAKQGANGQQARGVDDNNISVDLSRVNAVTLHRRIVAWGGQDFCVNDHREGGHEDGNGLCRPYALTIENVQALDEEVAQGILEALQQEVAAPLGAN